MEGTQKEQDIESIFVAKDLTTNQFLVFVRGRYKKTFSEQFPTRAAAWDYAEKKFGVERPTPKPDQHKIDASDYLNDLFNKSSETRSAGSPAVSSLRDDRGSRLRKPKKK